MVPAIAVADALRAEGAEVSFVGGQRAEAELVPAAGYPLDTIKVEGIDRRNPLKAARAIARAAVALKTARAILRDRGADAVLGGGGYVAGPVGAAAVARRIPLVLTEADSHLGLTNRLLAGRARRVCLAFPIDGPDRRALPRHRPARARPDVAPARRPAPRSASARRSAACSSSAARSARARSTTRRSPRSPTRPTACCTSPGGATSRTCAAPGPHYDLRDYLSPFGQALAAADLAVARAGGSIFELAQYGVPAVLVPYPHATADHQTANARWMEQGGAAVVLADATLTPAALRAAVDAILLDPGRLATMAAAATRLARPDAAADVAREVLRAARSSIR